MTKQNYNFNSNKNVNNFVLKKEIKTQNNFVLKNKTGKIKEYNLKSYK